MLVVLALATVLLVSLVAPAVLKPLLTHWGILDVPNERSSHSRAVIRGVGLAPLLAMVAGYAVLLIHAPNLPGAGTLIVIIAVSVASGSLGWMEDAHGVRIVGRAIAQLAIGLLGAGFVVFLTGASWWLLPIFGIAIAAYINVANFMDGVDGISGLHGVLVGASYAVLGVAVGFDWLALAGSIVAIAFAAFLPWNLLRGGMFLGDVGSYLLGGGIAVIAVAAIASGLPLIGVLGPLSVYLADTGATLVRRVHRGEKWFEAHRSHVYQRLTSLGFSHLRVSLTVATTTALTSALGLLSLHQSGVGSVIAVCAISVVLSAYLGLPRFVGAAQTTARKLRPPAPPPISDASWRG